MTGYEFGPRRVKIVLDGERISALRRDLAWTQRELAIKARVSLTTICRIEENGGQGTTVYGRTWRNICKALGLKHEGDMESIRIYDEYIAPGGTTKEGEDYPPTPLTLEMKYDRMRRAEEGEE